MEFYYDDVEDDVLIIKADGGLNSDTADEFIENIEKLIVGGVRKLIIDCSTMDYISSYGLGVLVRLHRYMKELNGDVKIASVKSVLLDVLRLTRLSSFFAIYADVSQARLAFRPKAKTKS